MALPTYQSRNRPSRCKRASSSSASLRRAFRDVRHGWTSTTVMRSPGDSDLSASRCGPRLTASQKCKMRNLGQLESSGCDDPSGFPIVYASSRSVHRLTRVCLFDQVKIEQWGGCMCELPLRWRCEFQLFESTVEPINQAVSAKLLYLSISIVTSSGGRKMLR
jgi:hypothetical protein